MSTQEYPEHTEYTKDHPGYLGKGKDNSHREFDAFRVEDEIHLVYRMGTPNEFVSRETNAKILANMDRYLWTPFVEFAQYKES